MRAALALALLLSPSPALADSYFLSAPDQITMVTALCGAGQATGGPCSDWSSDWGSDFGGGGIATEVVQFFGMTPDGGNWRVRVIGTLYSPAPQSTPQPYEPGNYTNRAGLPIQPPYVTGLNPNVGVESIPDTVPAFWVRLDWNSGSPLPNYGAYGITAYRDGSGGSQALPYGTHY